MGAMWEARLLFIMCDFVQTCSELGCLAQDKKRALDTVAGRKRHNPRAVPNKDKTGRIHAKNGSNFYKDAHKWCGRCRKFEHLPPSNHVTHKSADELNKNVTANEGVLWTCLHDNGKNKLNSVANSLRGSDLFDAPYGDKTDEKDDSPYCYRKSTLLRQQYWSL